MHSCPGCRASSEMLHLREVCGVSVEPFSMTERRYPLAAMVARGSTWFRTP